MEGLVYYLQFDEDSGIWIADQINAHRALFRGSALRSEGGQYLYPYYHLDGQFTDYHQLPVAVNDLEGGHEVFVVRSLPNHGLLYNVNLDGSLGEQITFTPYVISSNLVAYRWEWYVRNI